MNTLDIASRFVDLALNKQWKEVDASSNLSDNEIQILFETVSAAGFKPQKLVLGILKNNELYPINTLCRFLVIDEEGNNLHMATGWLDCALRRVVSCASRKNKSRENLIEVISREIERATPLQPIQLTREGDMLLECTPNKNYLGPEYFVEHTKDSNCLISCVGIHAYCGGWMDRHRATKIHDALSCRHCYLRVLFPKEVNSYGELREAMKLLIKI